MPSKTEKARRKKLMLDLKYPNTCHCGWDVSKPGRHIRTEKRVQKDWDPYCAIGTVWYERICLCAVCGKERPCIRVAMA
jgi:hypothetical protein